MLIVKVFNASMCRMRYADDDDAGTFCLFLFLYIWLFSHRLLTVIVAFGQVMGAAAATLATAKAAATMAVAKATPILALAKAAAILAYKTDYYLNV